MFVDEYTSVVLVCVRERERERTDACQTHRRMQFMWKVCVHGSVALSCVAGVSICTFVLVKQVK